MRILYISNSYVPSRRASAVHVMKMCDAFCQAGHAVELVVKKNADRTEGTKLSVFEYYGVPPRFTISALPRPSRQGGDLVYATQVARLVRSRRPDSLLLYSRDLGGALVASAMNIPLIFESHGVPAGPIGRRMLRRVVRSRSLKRLVVISEGLRSDLERVALVPEDSSKILVAHDCAALPDAAMPAEALPHSCSKSALQVGYVGSLYPGRGIESIFELARRLPEIAFQIVGGSEADLKRWKEVGMSPNLKLHGFVEPSRVPGILKGFDVLLMPHGTKVLAATGRSDISRWTSPLKMFEYMASGRPLIASRLPVLEEVLTDGINCLLVDAGDVESWSAAIRRLAGDHELRKRLGETARRHLEEHYTWEARAGRILSDLEGVVKVARQQRPAVVETQ